MEKEIVNIIFHKIRNHQIQKLYEEEATSFEFPPHIDVDKIPFNIVFDFEEQYYDTFKSILLENSFIYSCLINDDKFKEHFINCIDNLNNEIEEDMFFKLKICEYAIKHIFNKTFDKSIDESEVRNEFKNILKKLDKIDTKMYSITYMYRKFIMDYLKEYKDDFEIVLDEILSTNTLDNDLIKKSNGLLNQTNIKIFKSVLFRLILTDNFIYIQNVLNAGEDDEFDMFEPEIVTHDMLKDYSSLKFKDNEHDEDEEYIDEENDEYIDEENDEYIDEGLDDEEEYTEEDIKSDQEIANEININIMNYIKKCIENNKYVLPKDDEIRYNLYSIFFAYNDYDNDRKSNIETICENEENAKSLKKLNPLYLMDLINGSN